jgi:glutamyl-tRNA reductase
MEILLVGLNHSTAPVEVRERITFQGDADGAITRGMAQIPGVQEALIISTCNRAEVLAVCSSPELVERRVIDHIGSIHESAPADFRNYLYTFCGEDAVRHLFRVASSLDSMVIGEPQILGQVKESYRRAVIAKAAGPILNRLMHRAFFTAKRVRNETGVGRAAVSVAYVAVELAGKILGDLKRKTVLLIGAGEMAELAARHLAAHVDGPIHVVNRTFETACELARELSGRAFRFERMVECLTESDVVITSTASCEPILRADDLRKVLKLRRYRPLFLIDIAIPRDVEPEANEIDGVYLYNIDDLQTVAAENVSERREEARKAESLVEEEIGKFMAWKQTLAFAPTIVAFKEKLERIREAEVNRLNGKLGHLGASEREAVEAVTRAIVNKIAHEPIVFLKHSGVTSKGPLYLDAVQKLFGLDSLSGDAEPEDVSMPGKDDSES